MPVEIDQNLCGKCLGCATICPENIYYFVEENLTTNQDDCTDCGTCIECCPVKAISEI